MCVLSVKREKNWVSSRASATSNVDKYFTKWARAITTSLGNDAISAVSLPSEDKVLVELELRGKICLPDLKL